MAQKHLILVRHGDAENPSLKIIGNDLSRKLTSVGITKIKRLSKFLEEENIHFDKIITSHSCRTFQTAEILAENLKFNKDLIDKNKLLYNCTIKNYTDIIENVSSDINNILLVGHSPTITEFGEYLVGKPIGHLQPGGIIFIKLGNIEWKKIHKREGKLLFAKNFLQDTLKLA